MSRINPSLGEVIFEDSNEVYVSGGQPRRGVNVVVGEDVVEQYRTGYRCLRCHGIQDEPFPEVCKARDLTGTWRCGFEMRDNQIRFLENEHRGSEWYGPSPDLRDVWDDQDERENFQKRTGIWVPGKGEKLL